MTRLAAALCTFAFATCLAHAQTPAAPQAPRPAPKNLKALPKDTTGEQVVKYMHQYTGDLGVGCNFCHAAPDPATKHVDWSSDANPMKDTARFMITMTAELNEKVDAMPNKMFADPSHLRHLPSWREAPQRLRPHASPGRASSVRDHPTAAAPVAQSFFSPTPTRCAGSNSASPWHCALFEALRSIAANPRCAFAVSLCNSPT